MAVKGYVGIPISENGAQSIIDGLKGRDDKLSHQAANLIIKLRNENLELRRALSGAKGLVK